MQLLNEIDRIKSVMGVMVEDKNTPKALNINLSKSVEALRYLKIYNPTIERMLFEITNLAKEQIIDFGLLERGLRKVLLKKGDKKRNVSDYFGKIISSLKFREKKRDMVLNLMPKIMSLILMKNHQLFQRKFTKKKCSNFKLNY